MPSEFIAPSDVYPSSESSSSSDIADIAAPLIEWKGWIKFIAIIQIACSVVYILVSLFIALRGIGAFSIGTAIALLPIYLSILMLQTLKSAERAHLRGDASALKTVLSKAKTYFLVQAIVTAACFLFASLFTLYVANLLLAMRALHQLPH